MNTNTKLYRFVHAGLLKREHHDLGMVDNKGRPIGALTRVCLQEVHVYDGGSSIWERSDLVALQHPVRSKHVFASVQTARNGRSYGASQPMVYIGPDGDKETEKKLAEYVDKRIAAMKKRYLGEIEHKKRHGMTKGQRR